MQNQRFRVVLLCYLVNQTFALPSELGTAGSHDQFERASPGGSQRAEVFEMSNGTWFQGAGESEAGLRGTGVTNDLQDEDKSTSTLP